MPPPSSFRFHVKATFVFLFCSFSSLPCHWPCSVPSWLGQCESWWNVYKETYSETWSIFNQWLLTRMGILRRVGWNIVIFSVLFVICPSREVHLKRWGSGWDIRWKDSDLFDINGILVPRDWGTKPRGQVMVPSIHQWSSTVYIDIHNDCCFFKTYCMCC